MQRCCRSTYREPEHDAVYMVRLTPVGMIFIQCKDCISHTGRGREARADQAGWCCRTPLLERAGVSA